MSELHTITEDDLRSNAIATRSVRSLTRLSISDSTTWGLMMMSLYRIKKGLEGGVSFLPSLFYLFFGGLWRRHEKERRERSMQSYQGNSQDFDFFRVDRTKYSVEEDRMNHGCIYQHREGNQQSWIRLPLYLIGFSHSYVHKANFGRSPSRSSWWLSTHRLKESLVIKFLYVSRSVTYKVIPEDWYWFHLVRYSGSSYNLVFCWWWFRIENYPELTGTHSTPSIPQSDLMNQPPPKQNQQATLSSTLDILQGLIISNQRAISCRTRSDHSSWVPIHHKRCFLTDCPRHLIIRSGCK